MTPTLDLTHAPRAIRELADWLESEGFSVVHLDASGQINQYAELISEPLTVEITATRGDWDVAIGMRGMSRSYHPDTWEAWLDHFPRAGEPSDLDHQVDFIKNRWREAVARAETDPKAERELHEIAEDWVHREFGLPPDPWGPGP
jgi:hypothetical protein